MERNHSNSGSNCTGGNASCGGNTGDQNTGNLPDLPLCPSGSDCFSVAQALCGSLGLACGTKTLQDNLETDQSISDMTKPYADPLTGPYLIAQSPNAVLLLQINQLEQINLIIDNVALGNFAMSALDQIPGVNLLPPGVGTAEEAGINYFESVRDQNNKQIDQWLQKAAPPAPQPRP